MCVRCFVRCCHIRYVLCFPARRSSDLAYDQGYHFTFDRGAWILVVALAVLVGGWWSYTHLHKETMPALPRQALVADIRWNRSEEHTSELQSRGQLVCRLLLEKKRYFNE